MIKILGADGKPLDLQPLKEAQTAKLAGMTRLMEHPSKGLTPQKLYRVLEDAEAGDTAAQHALFADMEEKDGHLFAEMSKRRRALLTLDWRIEPAHKPSAVDTALADEVSDWLHGIECLDELILGMADALGHGFSAQEIIWQQQGGLWLPQRLQALAQDQFNWNKSGQLELKTQTGSEPLWDLGWLVHIHQAKAGMIARAGLHRILVWPYLYKHYSLRDFAEFLEIYGLPLRVGKYPAGTTDAEKSALLNAVANIGHNASGIIPDAMALEFQNAAAGSADNFMAMIDWADKTTSKVILGGTLTSGADGKTSTNALGMVHNEVRHDLLKSDARQLASTLTNFIRRLCLLNKPNLDPNRLPRFVFAVEENEDISLLAEALPKLVGLGMQVPLAWAHQKLGIPQAQDKEPVLIVASPDLLLPDELRKDSAKQTAKASALPDSALAVLRGRVKILDGNVNPDAASQDALDKAVVPDGLLQQFADDLTQDLAKALQEGVDPADLLQSLSHAYPLVHIERLQDFLAQVIFVTETWGRLEAGKPEAAR